MVLLGMALGYVGMVLQAQLLCISAISTYSV